MSPPAPIEAASQDLTESWRWRTYHKLEGRGLRCLEEAEDGSIWFGVTGGILRYDGLEWTHIEIADEVGDLPVNVLCQARDGSIYAGTEVGIYRYADGAFHREFPREGEFPFPVDDLYLDRDGAIWAGSAWGALRLVPGEPVLFSSAGFAAALRQLAPWLQVITIPEEATPAIPWTLGPRVRSLGLRVAEPGSEAKGSPGVACVVSQTAPGGPSAEAGIEVGDRLLALDGARPIFYNLKLGYVKTDSATLTVVRKTEQDTIDLPLRSEYVAGACRSFSVVDVYQSRDSAMWFGLDTGEIVRFDPSTGRHTDDPASWRLYTRSDGLDQGCAPRIAQTSDGDMWVVSNDSRAGINRFDGKSWERVETKITGVKTTNTSILETPDGTLWIGGNCLLSLRDGEWLLHQQDDLDLPSVRTRLLLSSSHYLWIAGLEDHAVRLDYGSSRVTTYQGMAYQCEDPEGSRWFVSNQAVIREQNGQWTTFTKSDGVMDQPVGILASRSGALWAYGTHQGTASLAASTGAEWHRMRYPNLAIRFEKMAEGPSGEFWLHATGATSSTSVEGIHTCQAPSAWGSNPPQLTPLPAVGLPGFLYAFSPGPGGKLWAGGAYLAGYDGQAWTPVPEPRELATTWIEVIYSGVDDVWVGTRTYGLFQSEGTGWRQHDTRTGLPDNSISGISQAPDGAIWTAMTGGLSRFDGRSWSEFDPDVPMPSELRRNGLQISRDGAVWVNHGEGDEALATTRFTLDGEAPNTGITFAAETALEGTGIPVRWEGHDPWKHTAQNDLQFAWRVDDGDWSTYAAALSTSILGLAGGDHTFEVRARDTHFNEDPTPAILRFTVLIPIWRQAWFIGLVTVFMCAIAIQTIRVVRKSRNLRDTNLELFRSNVELTELNAELNTTTGKLRSANRRIDRERGLERVRAEVTAMKQAEDLERVVGDVLQELRIAGLHFDLCLVNIVDEAAGLHRQYGGTVSGYSGMLEQPLTRVSGVFIRIWRDGQTVVRGVDAGLSNAHLSAVQALGVENVPMPKAVLDAPFEYGTLSLSTHEETGFSDSDIQLAGEFATVVELGYARYLDFQRLELQNQDLQELDALKSEFYQMVVHDLSQPVTGIQLCTDNILSRLYGELSPRQVERLETIRLSTSQLTSLLDALGSQMTLDPKTRTPVAQLAKEVSEVQRPVAESKGIVLDVSADEAFARADARYVREIISNLVSNALNYTGSGSVRVEVRLDGKGAVLTSITDTGMGIGEDDLPRVFTKRYRTSDAIEGHSGKGLGLYFCKKYVEIMGGRIWVESEIGVGSTFTFTLPEAASEA